MTCSNTRKPKTQKRIQTENEVIENPKKFKSKANISEGCKNQGILRQVGLQMKLTDVQTALVLLVVVGYWFWTYCDYANQPINATVTSAQPPPQDLKVVSQILYSSIKACKNMMNSQLQISQESLLEEELTNLLKMKLRPVQERMTSLRTQTSLYEKMERISGGPTSFIKSSIEELDTIATKQLHVLDMEVLHLITIKLEVLESILKSVGNVMDYFSIQTITNPKLLSEGIHLIPPNFDVLGDAVFVKNFMTTWSLGEVTLDQILQAVTVLANKFEEMEEVFKKLSEKLGIEDWSHLDMNKFKMNEKLLIDSGGLLKSFRAQYEDLKSEISRNEKLYQLLFPMSFLENRKIHLELTTSMSNIWCKHKVYLDIQTMIKEDMRVLKTRILNLQLKYPKMVRIRA